MSRFAWQILWPPSRLSFWGDVQGACLNSTILSCSSGKTLASFLGGPTGAGYFIPRRGETDAQKGEKEPSSNRHSACRPTKHIFFCINSLQGP